MRETSFNIVPFQNQFIQFIGEKAAITVKASYYKQGKHYILDPQSAHATFVCRGKQYYVENTALIKTVEDWYLDELLPKIETLSRSGGM